jgi:hypothetical protein
VSVCAVSIVLLVQFMIDALLGLFLTLNDQFDLSLFNAVQALGPCGQFDE